MAESSEYQQFEAIKNARQLFDLSETFGTESIHEIYFSAKDVWADVIREQQQQRPDAAGLPGQAVSVDGTTFHVHGVTHSGTDAEEQYLRNYVTEYLDSGAAVYCEQGIRSMYFDDLSTVCEMDDYLWAMNQCEELDEESPVDSLSEFESVVEDIRSVSEEFREATFSVIDSASSMYSDRVERALGDIAASFLTGHADIGVGKSYEAFQLRKEASHNPEQLDELQEYYERTFLPQPLEREWLRYHDLGLEIVSHARNERMADYAVYHNQESETVHVIVGAAHQPGVSYYLEQYNEGRELPENFELY